MKASAGSTKSAEAISAAPSGSGSGSGGKESESTFNPSGRTRKIATEQGQDPLSSLTNEDGNGNGNGNGNAVASSSTSSSDQEAASESFDDGRRPQVYEYGINVEEHIADALAVEEIDVDLYKSIVSTLVFPVLSAASSPVCYNSGSPSGNPPAHAASLAAK
jgi:hypothetical protein